MSEIEPLEDPQFLSVADVVEIHSEIIDAITPGEPKDILSPGQLEAAVLAPQQTFDGEFLYPTTHQMAATYMYGLVMGQAFQQGNKRVAYMSCYVFLKLNGFELTLSNDEAIKLTLDVVAHAVDRDQLAQIIADHVKVDG